MSVEERLSVPIGRASTNWSTRPDCRRVLVVAHTVTSLTRLLDVLPLLESDFRVQVVFTRARTSHFREGVTEFLADLGVVVAPWEQATEEEFDLAIAASYGDDLQLVRAPLVVLSHGAGYNKLVKPETGNRKPETGNRKPETGNRKPETETPETVSGRGVFGLSAETLIRDGRLVPSALVLSHGEQRERMRRTCPEALPATVVAGDPTHDRILAGRSWRGAYRDALDADGRDIVLITSTWGPTSLLGQRPQLVPRLLRDLPVDEFRLVLAAHPNAWHAHGAWQMRTWLASCERAGLAVLPPRAGWQAALVAADHVIGDHGSVTFYGAALGTHTMLGTFPHDELDPSSPVAEFGRSAPLLADGRPLLEQLTEDAARHRPDRFAASTRLLTSLPAESGSALRSLFYELMGLAEPDGHPRTVPPDLPDPYTPSWPHAAPVGPLLVTAEGNATSVQVQRHPAELAVEEEDPRPDRAHLVVDSDEPDAYWREAADVLVRRAPLGSSAREWVTSTVAAHPACRIAVAPDGDEGAACLVATRGGAVLRIRPDGAGGGLPPDLCASALWRVRAEGADLTAPTTVKVRAGRRQAVLRIAPLPG